MKQPWLILASTQPFVSPMNLPAPHGHRAAVEQAVRDGVDFATRVIEVDLSNARLEGMKATGAVFTGSLENAKLIGCSFERAEFRGSLSGADASQANCNQASLSGADLTGLQAMGADFGSANLRGANCTRMAARGARFMGAHFERAITQGMDVEDTNIFRAHVSHEQLRAMATPYDDIQFQAVNGRTRAQANAAAAEAAALGEVRHFAPNI